MKRNRKLYALRRLSQACDRAILRRGDPEKVKAWARAWAAVAGIKPAGST
jgi:hypothetical protein